jgi:uncharacterized membrane protein YkvA (DUF1232 family)
MWLLKLRRLFKSAGTEALILALAVRDPATPLAMRIGAAAALAYLISPVDLIPDIPLVGWVDDALILGMGLPYLLKRLPPDVLDRATQRAEHLLGMFRLGGARGAPRSAPASAATAQAPVAPPGKGPRARGVSEAGAGGSIKATKATKATKSTKVTKVTKAATAATTTKAATAANVTHATKAPDVVSAGKVAAPRASLPRIRRRRPAQSASG